MDIAIFGAGIAGLTAALALRAQGHRCRIYETSRECLKSGMGFILMPAGIESLKSTGVHLNSALSGALLRHYHHRNAEGEIRHEQAMPAGACSIRRSDLLAALIEAIPSDMLKFGAKLDHLEFDQSGHVTTALLGCGTGVRGDLFVAADGVRSRARKAIYPDWPSSQARVLELVGLVQCDHTTRWANNNLNKFHADSGGLAFGILPAGNGNVIWYLQFDAQRFPLQYPSSVCDADARRAFADKLVGDWASPIPQLLAATDFSRVHVWRPVNTDVVPRFYQGNLVLVGDAAHPLSPFSSQGTASAIADGIALATALQQNEAGQGAFLDEKNEWTKPARAKLARAFSAYSTERRHQRLPYVAQGRALSEQFLLPEAIRTATLPIAQ